MPTLLNRPRLKPLKDQVVVIMGASSGIGRESALQCAARGARVVVAARSEPGLRSLVAEIEAAGGEAAYSVCDVANYDDVLKVADTALGRFGRIDTWVQAAATGVYATIEDTDPADFRRVMDVNVTGYLHGAKAALPHLRREGRGALIFISSVESTMAMPLQGAYVASRHAVQGLAETLRRELMAEGAPISVTSVKPAVINTPFYTNAFSTVGFRPKAPPPAYHPAAVAQCVVYAAEHPARDLYAGGVARFFSLAQFIAPDLMDAGLAVLGIPIQKTKVPAGPHALYEPRESEDRVVGDISPVSFRFSPYTWLQLHPKVSVLAAAATVGIGKRLLARRERG